MQMMTLQWTPAPQNTKCPVQNIKKEKKELQVPNKLGG
jgi:hypothetical protein